MEANLGVAEAGVIHGCGSSCSQRMRSQVIGGQPQRFSRLSQQIGSLLAPELPLYPCATALLALIGPCRAWRTPAATIEWRHNTWDRPMRRGWVFRLPQIGLPSYV